MRRCFVALRSDDIDATHDQLRRTGVTVSPIVDGQRNDPQGNIIRWRIFTIDGDTAGLVYPFVLQWEEDDATRLTRLRAQRLDAPHPLGDITLEQAVFEVVNPQAVRDRWQALLGFPPLGSRDWTWAASNLSSVKGCQPADRTGVPRRQPGA